ncbi:reverse transcriptase domain-containing protein [Tanacetum coccineum]|uniref:Reverse transcriptase domain-containing protein n=1 Tax=Tanacetum coccineum TaxID=301880 RepID=A0ABQ5CE39_9ASTR
MNNLPGCHSLTRREGFNKSKKNPSWDNNKGQKNKDRFSSYCGSNHGLLSNLSKSPKEILATEKVARTFEQPPCMLENRRSRDMTKYCHFHKDHGHDNNDCGELRHRIKEAGEWKNGDKDTTPAEALILMISRRDHTINRKSLEELTPRFEEITFSPVARVNNSSDPIIIKAKIFGRQVNRVHMDNGSSCEVIYKHCFLKLKPSIKSLRVDSKVSLVGFSREHSSPIGEVPLEIIKGDSPFSRTETLNFIIVQPNSSHNLLLRRTVMQKIDSLDLNGDNRERTRLRLFQFSLRDQASNWLERLPAGSISTWEDLTTRFLAQFFPPERTAKLRNDIFMFQQHQGESLSEA